MKEKYLNMKSKQSKKEGKEKEEAPKTPTYAAVSRQTNVSKDVKKALPQFEAIIDHL